jgi:thiosulfate reductase cytochrome b subunit
MRLAIAEAPRTAKGLVRPALRNRLSHNSKRELRPPFAASCAARTAVLVSSQVIMLHSTHLPQVALQNTEILETPRQSLVTRFTHWIHFLSFIGLAVSGVGILLAHPRLYWGETGGLGTPSVLDLPLPFMLGGPSGWGRYLHFLSAWICVLTGLAYVIAGFWTGHFQREFVPAKTELSWSAVSRVFDTHLRRRQPQPEDASRYNILQKLSYAGVVFLLLPVMLWTGMAMSPSVVSVFPFFVTLLGGQQTARTVHFFVAVGLVAFVIVHVALVCISGFRQRMGAMITGRTATKGTP